MGQSHKINQCFLRGLIHGGRAQPTSYRRMMSEFRRCQSSITIVDQERGIYAMGLTFFIETGTFNSIWVDPNGCQILERFFFYPPKNIVLYSDDIFTIHRSIRYYLVIIGRI